MSRGASTFVYCALVALNKVAKGGSPSLHLLSLPPIPFLSQMSGTLLLVQTVMYYGMLCNGIVQFFTYYLFCPQFCEVTRGERKAVC